MGDQSTGRSPLQKQIAETQLFTRRAVAILTRTLRTAPSTGALILHALRLTKGSHRAVLGIYRLNLKQILLHKVVDLLLAYGWADIL